MEVLTFDGFTELPDFSGAILDYLKILSIEFFLEIMTPNVIWLLLDTLAITPILSLSMKVDFFNLLSNSSDKVCK